MDFSCSIASGRVQFQDFGMASVHVNSQLFVILELSCDLIRAKVFFLLVLMNSVHVCKFIFFLFNTFFVLISFLHLIYLVDLSLSE